MPEAVKKPSRKAVELAKRGSAALEQGSLNEANRLFREALKHDPQNLNLLILAAGSSATRQEAMGYLKQAQILAPGSTELQKSLDWAKMLPAPDLLPEKKAVLAGAPQAENAWWVSQPLPPRRRVGGWMLWLAGIGLVILAGTFFLAVRFYSPPLRTEPATEIAAAAPTRETSATLRSLPATWTPKVSGTPVAATEIPRGTRAFVTATPQATVMIAFDSVNYPPVDIERFYADPGVYDMQRLSITGQIISLGEMESNGVMSFAVLLDVRVDDQATLQPRSPVLLVDILPSSELTPGLTLRVYGVGTQPGGVLMVQGLRWDGPVVSFRSMDILP